MNNGHSQLLKLPSANPSWPGSFGINCVQNFYPYHYRKSTRVTLVFLFWEHFPCYYPLCYWERMVVCANTWKKYVWHQPKIPSVLKCSPTYECSDMWALANILDFLFKVQLCQLSVEWWRRECPGLLRIMKEINNSESWLFVFNYLLEWLLDTLSHFIWIFTAARPGSDS